MLTAAADEVAAAGSSCSTEGTIDGPLPAEDTFLPAAVGLPVLGERNCESIAARVSKRLGGGWVNKGRKDVDERRRNRACAKRKGPPVVALRPVERPFRAAFIP